MRSFKRRLAATSILTGVLFMQAPMASAAELAANAPETYTVRTGDTMWSIAGRFLRDPWRWPEVWQASEGISDPDEIYPGDVLFLTTVDGQPRVGLRRAGGGRASRGGAPVVRLSPQVRSSAMKQPVPMVPMASIGPFLSQPYIAESDDIKRAAYVVDFAGEHMIAGLGDSVYVRKIMSAGTQDYQVLRPGDELRDPDTNELLGYQAEFVANAVLQRTGDPAKLKIVRMERQVSMGDRVIPADPDRPLENLYPKPAPSAVRGRLLSVMNGVSQIGQYDIVVVNRGSHEGIQPGHVFEIFSGGEKARDQVRAGDVAWDWKSETPLSSSFWLGRDYERKGWRRDEPDPDTSLPIHTDYRRVNTDYIKPFERSGVLLVFRTFDRVSFGIVMSATSSIRVGDWIDAPLP